MTSVILAVLLVVVNPPTPAEPPAQPEAEVRAARTAQEYHEPNVSGSAHGNAAVPEPWYSLAVCESGMGGEPRWDYNGPSGFDGGLQFHPDTWRAFAPRTAPPYAYQASPELQVAVARKVQAAQGWGAWPKCSRKIGLR